MSAVATKPFEIATHNGIITVRSNRTGEHRTFRIKTQKESAKFAPGKRLLQILAGPDNTADYLSVGFVDGSRILLWKKYIGSEFYQWARKCLERPEDWTEKVEFRFEGHCRRCNRLLTDFESIEFGMGPYCRGEE